MHHRNIYNPPFDTEQLMIIYHRSSQFTFQEVLTNKFYYRKKKKKSNTRQH